MSKLEELEEELYGRESEEEVARRMRSPRYEGGAVEKPAAFWGSGAPKKKPSSGMQRILLKIFAVIFVFLGIAAAAFFIFFYLGTRGQEMEITIHATGRVETGKDVVVPIVLKNVSDSALEDVELAIELPRGAELLQEGVFSPPPARVTEKLADFAPSEERVKEITVRIFGKEKEEKKIAVSMIYHPARLNARFTSKAEGVFVIERVPLVLSWDAPRVLASGQDILLSLQFSSAAKILFKNISFRFEPPPGFSFLSSAPKPDVGELIWRIGAIEPGGSGTIAIRGRISGESGEIKVFRGELGVFNEFTKEWTPYNESLLTAEIEVSPLSVQTLLQGSRNHIIEPGETLVYTLRYRNNSTFSVQNVTVQAYLDEGVPVRVERFLDFPSLQGSADVFDEQTRALLWGPALNGALKELEPGKEGELTFRINTKSRPIVRNPQDKNFLVTVTSSIKAGTIPRELQGIDVSSKDILESKVSSQVLFNGQTAFRDSPLANSGPLPPRVGVKTTYTLLWEIRNFTNDLAETEIVATIPDNVSWDGIVFPNDAKIVFSPASREMRWAIGNLGAGVGVVRPSISAAVQVSIIPSEVDVGKTLTLAGEAKLSGRDTFTNKDVSKTIDVLTTELRKDTPAVSGEWSVVR